MLREGDFLRPDGPCLAAPGPGVSLEKPLTQVCALPGMSVRAGCWGGVRTQWERLQRGEQDGGRET